MFGVCLTSCSGAGFNLLGFSHSSCVSPFLHAHYHQELIHLKREYERNEPHFYDRNSNRLVALPWEDGVQLSYRRLTCSGSYRIRASCCMHGS